MDTTRPLPLLGGLSPDQFMRRHWQKKPLLVRQAVPGFDGLIAPKDLFALAAQEDVESRLVVRERGRWRMRRGPFARRALPALNKPDWTLLVQGLDLHHAPAHALLQQFAFIPQARLDDLMVSFATDGGGVGPHFDSYDVFLLQARGRRRWRYGRQQDLALEEGLPLKILAHFEPEFDVVLEPGDMLYLPPRYAHDGIAEGECQTCSIGFRAPQRGELARDLLQRLADGAQDLGEALYADPKQPATDQPGAVPEGLRSFAHAVVQAAMKDPGAIDLALGEVLSEPKPNVWFESGGALPPGSGLRLDARTRMLHDARHVFVNGESWRAAGRDAALMRRLADRRHLTAKELARASDDALDLLSTWCEAGWAHATGDDDGR